MHRERRGTTQEASHITTLDTTRLQDIKRRYSIVGNCPQLNRALDTCLQVASTDLSVLIIGESGVGKEVLPRIIHDSSPRRREKYFAINCGSIPEGTIDSELFGHEKGSFTGAIGESDGYFGIADRGTLFLDEVGELPLATQARLLRVLETGEYIRVGGQEVRHTNVRIVAATNVNMRRAISEGRFREDLYYRLNTIPVQMPPLRDRGTDILLLFRLFAMQMTEKYRVPRLMLTPEAEQLMLKYKWPGNVRQLKNITEQLCVLSTQPQITAQTLLQYIPDDEETTAITSTASASSEGSHSYASERQMLFNALFELQNNYNTLSATVHELQKLVRELGGNPHTADQPVRGLLPHPSYMLPDNHASVPSAAMDNDAHTHHTTVHDISSYEDAVAEELSSTSPSDDVSKTIHETELDQIRKALERNNGNRQKTADELGISARTLYRRLHEL